MNNDYVGSSFDDFNDSVTLATSVLNGGAA